VDVPVDAFDDDKLPAHLRMTFRVVGDRGGVVDEGTDLQALARRLSSRTQEAVDSAVRTAVRAAMEEARRAAGAAEPGGSPRDGGPRLADSARAHGVDEGRRRGDGRPTGGAARAGAARAGSAGPPASAPAAQSRVPDLSRTGLTTWPADVPELPDVVEAGTVRAYPSLVDERSTVALRTLADPAARDRAHRAGLRRLLLLDVGLQPGRVTSRWTGTQALALASSPYRDTNALVTDVQLAAIDHLVTTPATTAAAYAELRAHVRDRLEDEVHAVVGTLVQVLTAWRELDADLRGATSLALVAAAADVRAQQQRLVHAGFVAEVGAERLGRLPRYLRAARHRLAKAAENPQRDADLAWQVSDVEDAVAAARRAHPDDPRVDEAAWLVEELRVSLFAQQLGTPVPVSPQRVRKTLAALDR
jgi:ATP-dependent helicase HrpA